MVALSEFSVPLLTETQGSPGAEERGEEFEASSNLVRVTAPSRSSLLPG
jgi:hypothetical protein